MKSKFTIQPGNEIRGFKIRLYPTKEQEELLKILQGDLRYAWNHLVNQVENVIFARKAYALKNGLVPERPLPPNYNGLSNEQSKETKKKYISDCSEWNGLVWKAMNDLPECQFRKFKEMLEHFGCKQDYQLLTKIIDSKYENSEIERKIKPAARLLQSFYKNYETHIKGQKRKKFKKSSDPMPLQVKSWICFELGNFGERRGNSFYNCQIKINGLKIKGRLPGKEPSGRILEGVSLTKLADGWYASIKEEVPKRVLTKPIKETVIGIDVGLDVIAAISAPKGEDLPEEIVFKSRIENPRGKELSEKIAEMQKKDLPVGRLHLKMKRQVEHIIYNDILKALEKVETIKIEKLSKSIGQMGGSSKQSSMRKIASMLKQRFGDRIKEVNPAFTSQDCSECGHRSKEDWCYENGPTGKCPTCLYSNDRDLNAARNIAAKDPIVLDKKEKILTL